LLWVVVTIGVAIGVHLGGGVGVGVGCGCGCGCHHCVGCEVVMVVVVVVRNVDINIYLKSQEFIHAKVQHTPARHRNKHTEETHEICNKVSY
jgi:uncharacterized membrane protein YhiD involved in acid resistance